MLEGSAKAGQIIKAVKIRPGDTTGEFVFLDSWDTATASTLSQSSDKFMTEMIIWPEGELAGEGRDHPVWACSDFIFSLLCRAERGTKFS